MKKIEVISKVENGKFTRNRNRIQEAVESFEGKEVLFCLDIKRKKRSSAQNRYYFGTVIPIFQEALRETQGDFFSKDEVHEFLKGRFLYKEMVTDDGEIIKLPKSTTECTTSDMMDYIEECRRFGSEYFDVNIPEAGTQMTIE